MRHLVRAVPLVPLILLLCACTRPKREILADTFFYGHAYVDANGNGRIDEDDPGLEGAMFVVRLSKMGGLTARTTSNGRAMIAVPGGLSKKEWPVTASMNPPPDTNYELMAPTEIVLEYPAGDADFLFQDTQ